MEFHGYSLDCLRDDGEFVLYRAHPGQRELPSVLLLTPVSPRPSLQTLRKIDHEYSLRNDLESAWAVRPVALSSLNAQMSLVLEDLGGEPLNGLISQAPDMRRFLVFAAGLASALSGMHERGLIHKDLKPANALVTPATGQVRFTGFGIASRLHRERQSPEPPEFIAGTLPYMAPEQTGRMNRSIDSRSDLYALGVTLYEMLTGVLPFTASDPMEWVHCHIARQPVAPRDRIPGVPESVSAIIMKLLAKTPEERYQTASGVESDLRQCLAEWEERQSIADFTLGRHDAPDRLFIPEKLYGREREVETLLAAFDRVVAGGRPELVLVSGYSGIGKSAVVNELHKALVHPRGLFASGKFDQYKHDIPYATLAQAFQTLIHMLLTKSEEELNQWRDALREALDPNGQLMVGLVPALKAIIGEQRSVPELPQREAQARFHMVFRRFISVFARPEHTLALFLDDLQWLDEATLDFIEYLLTHSDIKHLLLIGAYRDNEVNAAHPLARKLRAMRRAGAVVQDVVLAPLTRGDLAQLTADSFHCEAGHTEPLAALVHDKTTGNPFFAIQFISALFEEGLLAFNHTNERWQWDPVRIHARGYTDNVVDLMVRKLARLAPETQNALKQLACLGNTAEFTTLGVVYQDSMAGIHAQLAEALGAGLVFSSNDAYHFLHDRVQEAVYSLIPEDLRSEAHLRIGRLLAEYSSPHEREEKIFEIVNQLNRGSSLISSLEDREQLAAFNLMAGKRAKASTAYMSALHYFVAGTRLLEDDGWDQRPGLMFSLELHRAECEMLTGDLAGAGARVTALAARATDTLERASVACLQIDLYTTLDQTNLAVDACLDYLRHLGIEWSPHPTQEEAQREYQRIWSQLGSRTIEDLIDMPLMSDPVSLATLDVLTRIYPSALHDANLLSMAVCRAVNLSLERGHGDGSCVAYVFFAKIAGLCFKDPKAGFRFGQLGYQLVEKRGLERFRARTCLWFAQFVVPWTKHLQGCRGLFRWALEAATRAGDFTAAVYSFDNLSTNFLAAGDPLAETQSQAEAGLELAERSHYERSIVTIKTQLGLIRTLRGLTHKFGSFDDGQLSEDALEQYLAANLAFRQTETECWYWIRKLQARFFAGDYSSALDAADRARRVLWTSAAMFEMAEYHFYAALSHAASCDSASPDSSLPHLEALAEHCGQLEAWAENCPENFENRAALAGAEIARIQGRVIEAEQLYERAIHSAHANGFVNNEALAYELAARFYATRGFQRFADAYLLEARYCYERWGADGKVAQLNRLFPHLEQASSMPESSGAIVAQAELLDLATVITVFQAVSGEIVPEKLTDRLMRTAVEHAGADRGLLILSRDNQLRIEAEATINGGDISVRQQHSSSDPVLLPESVVRYVMRTRDDLLLDDATNENTFSADPYIAQSRPRSVLCLPLINQAKLTGILYLENRLTASVFTAGRLAILKVLASQAAIALENSRLYRDLEDREGKIRRLIDSNIIGIVLWDLDGRLLDANDAFLRMVGYEREDVQAGLRWFDMTPPDWQEIHARYEAEELLTTGMMQPREKEYFRKDGSRVPVLIGAACFEGHPEQGVAYIVDLSQQKRAEEALRRSEAYLAEAQKQTHTGSCAIDGGSRETVYWSDEMFRIFDVDPRSGPPGWDRFVEHIHPDDRDKFRLASERLFHAKEACDIEYKIVKSDGTIRHIHGVGQPVLSPRGELIEVLGTMVDVTERKRAEAEREGLREAHRVVVETASDAVISADENGIIQFANPAAMRVFGYAPAELVGKPLTLLMPQSMQDMHIRGFRNYLATGRRQINWQGTELTGLHKDGREFPVEVSFGEMTTTGHRVFTGFLRDITERKQAEEGRERLRQMQAHLAHITRVSTAGELTASLAHEIKQPIGAAVTNAEACVRLMDRKEPDLPEAREAAIEMIKDARRAADIVDRVRLLYQKGAFLRDAVNLNEVIDEMARIIGDEAARQTVTVRIDLEQGLPHVMADRVQLQQALMNLMVNGIEAMHGIGGDLRIETRTAPDNQLLVSVSDTGTGVPADSLEKIFNAFFTTKAQGTGLGLAITRSIIQSHEGQIWVTSKPGEGTTFSFTLPVNTEASGR